MTEVKDWTEANRRFEVTKEKAVKAIRSRMAAQRLWKRPKPSISSFVKSRD